MEVAVQAIVAGSVALASRRLRFGALALSLLLPAWVVTAKPSIEGYDLVRSVRVDRTNFDYSYRIRVQGDGFTYTGATIEVASKSIVTGTTVVKSTVNVGQLDAEEFVRTSDVFTIRQDRTRPLDPSALTFSFKGTPVKGSRGGQGRGRRVR
jgi:hypothetical protein